MNDFIVNEAMLVRIGAALVGVLLLIVFLGIAGRMLVRFFRFWRTLPFLGKVVVPMCLTVFYLYGSTKPQGAAKTESHGASQSVAAADSDADDVVQPLHRYLAPTNLAADLSVFERPADAVTPKQWTRYSVVDDFRRVPGGLIAGVCGALTTQPWGIDTPDRIKDTYKTYAPFYSTNALVRGVSDFWMTTNEFSQTYVWKNVAHKCNVSNLVSFAATLYDWGDFEFTYGNVPAQGFTSFVKLDDKTLDLTGSVAPNRTIRVEKDFEQDTEWWLENYPEICYTNATGELVFDYDTNEWYCVELTFGATEPMAEYERDMDAYRRKVYDALGGMADIDNYPSLLKGYENTLNRFGKESMSPELREKYEPLFKTVTNITDAAVEKFFAYVWDGRRETREEFITDERVDFFEKDGMSRFITLNGPSIIWIDHYMLPSSRIRNKSKLKITEQVGLASGAVTNYYSVSYYDPYLVSNIVGPKPKLSDYYRISPLLLKNKDGETISPDFYMDFPVVSEVIMTCRDGKILIRKNERVEEDDKKKRICFFIKAGYVYKVSSTLPYQSMTNPRDLIYVRDISRPPSYVYKLTPKLTMALENVVFDQKSYTAARAVITPSVTNGTYTWETSDNIQVIKAVGKSAGISWIDGKSGWVNCEWDNGDREPWNYRLSALVNIAANTVGFPYLQKFLSIEPSSSLLACFEEHLDARGNVVAANGTNVMLTCSYGGQRAGMLELTLDGDLGGVVYENGVKRQLPYRWDVPGGEASTKILEARDLRPSGDYKYNLRYVNDALPEGFTQQATVSVVQFDVEADRTWPQMRKRHVFGPGEPFTIKVENESETKVVAPKVPGVYSTNVVYNGRTIPFSYTVIAPTQCIATNAWAMNDDDWSSVGVSEPLSAGEVGAGMCLELKLLPDYVSFEGLKVMEGECSATSIEGYYEALDMSNVRHNADNGAMRQNLVQEGNIAGIDRAGSATSAEELPQPWSYGRYQWNIPFYWSADDFATSNQLGTNIQRFQLYASGEFRVTKFGWIARRNINGEQTVTREEQ